MTVFRTLIGLGFLIAMVGCDQSNGGDGQADNDMDMEPDPDTPQVVEFASFVKTEIETTPATADATAINDVMFDFNNRDNPNAFDELFTD